MDNNHIKKMERYRNKYRIPSARLQSWDYGANGSYFITICTQHMHCYFGEVKDNVMLLNEYGLLAEKYWMEIADRFSYVELGSFVVMPNHIHGIVIVDKNANCSNHTINVIGCKESVLENRMFNEREIRKAEIEKKELIVPINRGGVTGEKNPMLHDNVSRIMNWFKGRCTYEIRKTKSEFEWHERFYDHVIQNMRGFENIHNYIENNPKTWNDDRFYR